MINAHGPGLLPETLKLLRLTKLRSHFCDSLRDVYARAKSFRGELEEQLKLEEAKIPMASELCRTLFLELGDENTLVIGALSEGFPGYANLRQLDPQLALLASHALLKPVAIRRGIGVPTMRGLVPAGVWEQLPTPVRAFVLEAAESFARPNALTPRLPTEAELEELSEPGEPMGLIQYGRRYHPIRYDGDHPEILGFVGLRRAADQYATNIQEHLAQAREIDEFILRWLQESPEVAEFEQALALRENMLARDSSIAILFPNDGPSSLEDTGSFLEFVRSYGPRHFVTRCGHILRRLGLHELIQEVYDRFEQTQAIPLPGWIEAVMELKSALYDTDIEQSLRMQSVLNLYPLHKRVLGLVEHVILPELKRREFRGNTSGLWTNAFLKTATDKEGNHYNGPLNDHPERWNLDRFATLETEGNWLLQTAYHNPDGSTGPMDLAVLLDGIVNRMTSADEVKGLKISLNPDTPQAHARQLAVLAKSGSKNAACMTLYLGKVALMLRNAVEHGKDRVNGESLLVKTKHYWKQIRPQKDGKPIFEWLENAATQKERWRSTLPESLPIAANAFLLTPASLQRCLVLLSLVLHSAKSHLNINYRQ